MYWLNGYIWKIKWESISRKLIYKTLASTLVFWLVIMELIISIMIIIMIIIIMIKMIIITKIKILIIPESSYSLLSVQNLRNKNLIICNCILLHKKIIYFS